MATETRSPYHTRSQTEMAQDMQSFLSYDQFTMLKAQHGELLQMGITSRNALTITMSRENPWSSVTSSK